MLLLELLSSPQAATKAANEAATPVPPAMRRNFLREVGSDASPCTALGASGICIAPLKVVWWHFMRSPLAGGCIGRRTWRASPCDPLAPYGPHSGHVPTPPTRPRHHAPARRVRQLREARRGRR